jgi:hypothetical protein
MILKLTPYCHQEISDSFLNVRPLVVALSVMLGPFDLTHSYRPNVTLNSRFNLVAKSLVSVYSDNSRLPFLSTFLT